MLRRALSGRRRSVLYMSYDIQDDLAIIANSIRLLPPWDEKDWWGRWEALESGFSLGYLAEKLWLITDTLHPGTEDDEYAIHKACMYVLVFFDNPPLYEHLDDVVCGMDPATPGQAGKRWSEAISEASWRIILATADSRPFVALSAEQVMPRALRRRRDGGTPS